MNEYELTVLIRPDLETDLEAPLEKVRTLVNGGGGKIIKEDNWGKKRLAYPINRENFAVYVYMECELPSEAPAKISSTLNITDDVMRYLLVRVDLKARKAAQEAAEKKADKE